MVVLNFMLRYYNLCNRCVFVYLYIQKKNIDK